MNAEEEKRLQLLQSLSPELGQSRSDPGGPKQSNATRAETPLLGTIAAPFSLVIERCRLKSLNVDVTLVGTEHRDPAVAAAAERLIFKEQPDAVMVELDKRRFFRLVFDEHVPVESRAIEAAFKAAKVEPWLSEPPNAKELDVALAVQQEKSTGIWHVGIPRALLLRLSDLGTFALVPLLHKGFPVAPAGADSDAASARLPPQAADYGGDMRRSALAALQVGATLILGDRDVRVTEAREASRSACAAIERHDTESGSSVTRVRRDDENESLGSVTVAPSHWNDSALCSEDLKKAEAAALEKWQSLDRAVKSAMRLLLEHGAALVDHAPDLLAADSKSDEALGLAIALGGRRGILAALLLRIRLEAELSWKTDRPFDSSGSKQHYRDKAAQADAELTSKLLTASGQLRPECSWATGTPELARARRAFARASLRFEDRDRDGESGASAWSTESGAWCDLDATAIGNGASREPPPSVSDHDTVLINERDAIMAASILHMRGHLEQAAAAAAVACLGQVRQLNHENLSRNLNAGDSEAALAAPSTGRSARNNDDTSTSWLDPLFSPANGVVTAATAQDAATPTEQLLAAASCCKDAGNHAPLGHRAAQLVDDWSSPCPLADQRLRFVAVVGAAHVPGILRHLRAADALAAQAREHLDKSFSSRASDAESAFDVHVARTELVRQGFLPAAPLTPLAEMFPGQQLPVRGNLFAVTQPGLAAHERALRLNQSNAIPRRALMRAVAACSVDDEVAPTLTPPAIPWRNDANPGLAFKLTHTGVPLVAAAACVILPFVRKAPRPLRIAAGATVLTAVAGAGAAVGAAYTVHNRLESALDAADRRMALMSSVGDKLL